MDTREKLNEFAELRGWNKNKPIGWSEAADFGDWLIKNCFIPDVMAMLPSSKTVEVNGIEGGLRDGELQMFWEGAEWLKSHLQKQLVLKGN